MSNRATPFLDISSFVPDGADGNRVESEAFVPAANAFLSVYETYDSGAFVDPETEEYATFLAELYDEELDDALASLASEASAIHEVRFAHEWEDPQTAGHQSERLLDQHFAPLVREAETLLGTLAHEFNQHNPNSLTEREIEDAVDRYQSTAELSPSFEEFFGKLKSIVKKVAKKGLALAKKGVAAAAKLGLGPILNKLKSLVRPLLQRVIQLAIGKLPAQLQPIAKKLADKFPLLKELEEAEACEVSRIQQEFNQEAANLLFARTEAELELEIQRACNERRAPDVYPVGELDLARSQFVESISRLREGEDPTPHVESFIPAILPVLKIGLRLAGRKRVVNFLAKLVAKLIRKFVGQQYAPALSQAIVDAGLRLIQLEATPEDESRAAAEAVSGTVEETVRRVAAFPDYVLDDRELFEGFALQAFEEAASANLPAVLPEETYRTRPDLAQAKKLRGTWVMMPRGARKRYKKFSRVVPVSRSPPTRWRSSRLSTASPWKKSWRTSSVSHPARRWARGCISSKQFPVLAFRTWHVWM